MHFPTTILYMLPFVAHSLQATLDTPPKANEYATGDCSGTILYSHHNADLVDVTMDDASHSVYLAGGQWVGFTEKTSNGGSCYGNVITALSGCNNLDNGQFNNGQRIRCVRNTSG